MHFQSWIAALLVKQILSHKESLVRANSELAFKCSRVEVDYIYSILSCMKSLFLEHTQGLQFDCFGTNSKQSVVSTKLVNESLSGATVRDEKINTKSMRNSSEDEECMTEKRCSHYSTATRDIEKTISGIKKKYKKQVQKLVQEHGHPPVIGSRHDRVAGDAALQRHGLGCRSPAGDCRRRDV